MGTHPPEPKKTFLEKMTNILNYGALNLGMALGYQTGLFDVMDTFDTPKTLSAIVEKSGLNSRYVAEWMGIMVSGDIVELSLDDTGQDLFYLPKAHGDLITRRAGNSNLGVYSILKENGTFSMIDIAAGSRLTDNRDHPMGPFLYTVSLMHCMPVGLVDGGTGLGMMWGRQKAVEMLKAAGFSRIDVAEIPDDPFNLHFLCRK